MFQSRGSSSLLLAVLLIACAPVRDAQARDLAAVRVDAKNLFTDGLHLVRRALGLDRDTAVVSHAVSLSPREAAVELELADGTTRTVSFRSGQVFVDGRSAGRYAPGGTLEQSWRKLLAEAGPQNTAVALARLRAFRVSGLSGAEGTSQELLGRTFRN
ncbi:MAG: hypothetical protein FIA95_10345, partial [Gemmatimonadetes bacterium]|nr:hypothetical protein [Gemmatimonadota bacterium]